MSRYHKLALAATEGVQKFLTEQRTCEMAATHILKATADYLECPADSIGFMELNDDLTALKPANKVVLLRANGAWNFCIRISFSLPSRPESLHSFVKFSASVEDDGVAITHEAKRFLIAFEQPEVTPLLDFIFDDISLTLSKPIDGPGARIGF